MATYKVNADGSITKKMASGAEYHVNTKDPKWKSIAQEAVTVGGVKGPIVKPSTKNQENNPTIETTTTPPKEKGITAAAYEDRYQPDTTNYINELKEAQRKSRIASLDKAKTNALSGLDTEQANVEPYYYNKRNEAAARSDVGAMNFAQYMAARGIKGAAGAMPEIYRNAGLQGQLGALDQQQAQNMANIERQRGLVQSNYEFDVANADADVESQAMQQLIEQYNQNRNYQLQLANLTGSLGGVPTLQKQQMDAQNTGYYNPWASYVATDDINNQLAPYMDDLRAFINQNPSSPLVPYAQNLRYQKTMSNPEYQEKYGSQYQTVNAINASLQNKAQELANIAQEIENSYLPETFKLQAERLKQQVKAGGLDYDTALAQLNNIKAQTSNVGASTALGWARFNYDKARDAAGQGWQANDAATNQAIADVASYQTAQEAWNALGKYGSDMAGKGVDINKVISAINQRFGTTNEFGF